LFLRILDRLEEILIASLIAGATLLIFVAVVQRYAVGVPFLYDIFYDINLTWAKAPFTITYGLQVIAKTNDIDDLEDVGGSALTAGNCLGTDAAYALRGGPYCPVYKLPRVAYHSLSAEIQATKDFSFTIGVANIFNKKPPLVSTVGSPITGGAFGQVPLLGSYYDYIGRRVFVTARAKLGGLLGL